MPARAWAEGARQADRQAEGLPLQLPAPSPFPGRIQPEEAVPCSEPFDSDDWRFSVDWEGARALMFVTPAGSVVLQSAGLTDLTYRFPELAAAGAAVLRRPAILDGVIALLDPTGRPDLPALGIRLVTEPEREPKAPAVFLATDVLQVEGRPSQAWPLDRRLETLAGLVDSDATIQVPDHVAGRGGALAAAAGERGLPALLARRGSAPYRPGVASPERLRIELAPRATCVVVGVEATRQSAAGRLILAEHVDGRLRFAGRVEGPRDGRVDAWLRGRLEGLRATAPAIDVDLGRGVRWLRPALCATVTHSGRGPDGVLQQAVLLALRDDVDPLWCVHRPSLPPPQEARRAAFMPTVLMPLPLGDTVLLPRQRH